MFRRAPLPIAGVWAGALLLAAALALYWSGLRHPLLFDDYHLGAYSLKTYYAGALSRFGELRWLSDATYGWVYRLSGDGIAGQRLASVFLHAATALVLFGFLRRLFGTLLADARTGWLAFFGALWFVLHPVAVYGAGYLMQRSIVLATLFSLAALWCTLEALLRRRAAWYVAAAAAYFLALSSKEHAVMLPAVALVLAVLVRGTRRELVPALAALAACAAIAAIVVVQRRPYLGAAYEPFAAEVLARAGADIALAFPLSVQNQATLFFRYLATWIFPWPDWISIDVRTSFPSQLVAWPHTAGFVAWLGYAALGFWLVRRGGRAGLAGFGLLFPWLLALTEVVAVRVQEPFVLYRSYLWMAGLPAVLPALTSRLGARSTFAALAALCLVLAGLAHERLQTFASPFALWDDAARKNRDPGAPYAERAYVNRGMAHLDAGRLAPAAVDFGRALELNPRSPDALLGRGTLRLRTGKLHEALEDFDQAIALDPKYGSPYDKRCIVKVRLQGAKEASEDCDRAVSLDPMNDDAWINRGVVRRALGDRATAMASYERALDLNPGNASAHYNYGVLLLESGRRDLFVRRHFEIACRARIPQACELLDRAR